MAILPPLVTNSSDGVNGTVILQWARGASAWSSGGGIGNTGHERLDEPITASPANGDTGMGLSTTGNVTVATGFGLTDTPADFVSMDTLSIRYSTAQVGTYSDDTGQLFATVFRSNGSTRLAAFSTTSNKCLDFFNGSNWTTASFGSSQSAPGYDKILTFEYVDTTATKADWDGAIVTLIFVDTRNMGSDAATIILVDFQLEGTYTPLKPIPERLTQLTLPAVRRGANW